MSREANTTPQLPAVSAGNVGPVLMARPADAPAQEEHRQALRVLVVDDSPALCHFLVRALSRDPELKVVGVAHDAFEARERIKVLRPDVLTLDVGMPDMDGLTFLGILMRLRPMPVIVLSALTRGNDAIAKAALDKGAFDVVAKPTMNGSTNHADFIHHLIETVKRCSPAHRGASLDAGMPATASDALGRLPGIDRLSARVKAMGHAAPGISKLIALGASTGGPEALRAVLSQLNADSCALVVVQHMPARFMAPFTRRLDSIASFAIRVAQDGETIQSGCGYVAPGNCHLTIEREQDRLVCRLHENPPVNGHRPSVDVLFASLAQVAGNATLAALLTGMGNDGARGLFELNRKGALTIAQDEHTSVVWGMPGKAVALGGVDTKLALDLIGPVLSRFLQR